MEMRIRRDPTSLETKRDSVFRNALYTVKKSQLKMSAAWVRKHPPQRSPRFFQAEDGIRNYKVMEFRRVLFRSRKGPAVTDCAANWAGRHSVSQTSVAESDTPQRFSCAALARALERFFRCIRDRLAGPAPRLRM